MGEGLTLIENHIFETYNWPFSAYLTRLDEIEGGIKELN